MRTVLCHGCFDVLHIGHVRHLQAARDMGDALIVSITAAEFITKPGRPIFTDEERKEMLIALSCVYEVYISRYPTGAAAIKKFMPYVYVKGIDYMQGSIDKEEAEACEKVGAQIRYTLTRKYSSTDIIKCLS